jgi:hypothetical protein
MSVAESLLPVLSRATTPTETGPGSEKENERSNVPGALRPAGIAALYQLSVTSG